MIKNQDLDSSELLDISLLFNIDISQKELEVLVTAAVQDSLPDLRKDAQILTKDYFGKSAHAYTIDNQIFLSLELNEHRISSYICDCPKEFLGHRLRV